MERWIFLSQLFGPSLADREAHMAVGPVFWVGVRFLSSAGQRLLLKSVHKMNQTSFFFIRVCLHREVYQNNYTLCYTSTSTLYDECSYFEISVSKQSCTGVFSSIIMLVNSEWRPAFRHRCYFIE